MDLTLRTGDPVRVRATASAFPGETGEMFKTDAADTALPYKVALDNGLTQWFGPDDLDYAPDRRRT